MSTHEQHKLNNLMQLIKNEVQQNSQTAGQLQQYSSLLCNYHNSIKQTAIVMIIIEPNKTTAM